MNRIDINHGILTSKLSVFDTFTAGVRVVTDSIGGVVFPVFEGIRSTITHLVSKPKLTIMESVISETKRSGSALLRGKKGDVLIEITQDEKGLFLFKSVGDFLKPVIIYEGTSQVVWEVKVSDYLTKIAKDFESVAYGSTASRWGKNNFLTLKESFVLQGLLREDNERVILQLPDEKPLTFKGPLAKMKAELVLKFYYQGKKTPMEEPSGHWGSLFIGCLYLSGFVLAPWARGNSLLDEKDALKTTSDGFFPQQNGDSSPLSQWENTSFQPNGYTQTFEYDGKSYLTIHTFEANKEIHTSRVCEKAGAWCEYKAEMESDHLTYTEKRVKGQKVEIQKSLFEKEGDQWRLVDQNRYVEARLFLSFASQLLNQAPKIVINAAITFLATIITKQNPNTVLLAGLYFTVSKVERALAEGVSDIRRRTSSQPISVINPSNLAPFSVELGQTFTLPIDLLSTYQLADPSLNIDLTIQQRSGLPPPAWIKLGMGPITQSSTVNLNGVPQTFAASGPYVYVVVSSYDGNTFSNNLVKVDIRTESLVWSQPLPLISAKNIFVQQDAIFLIGSNTTAYQIQVFNATTFEENSKFNANNYYGNSNTLVNNHIVTGYPVSNNFNNITSIDISNVTDLVVDNTISVTGYGSGSAPFFSVQGNFIYNHFLRGFDLINITSTGQMSKLATILVPYGSTCSAMSGQTLFIGSYSGVLVYNNTNPTNPQFLYSIFMGENALELNFIGSFLYVSTASGNLYVIDFYDLENGFITALVPNSYQASIAVGYLTVMGNKILTGNSVLGLSLMDASKRTLTVTQPTTQDRGLWFFELTATVSDGNSLVTEIPVHVGAISVPVVLDQVVYVGNSTTVTVEPFEFPNANFTYTTTPLPHFIQFNETALEFEIAPQSGHQGNYSIVLTGDDGYTGVASVSFKVIVPNRSPVFVKSLNNQTWPTGKFSTYKIPNGMAYDPDGDPVIYSGNLLGSDVLPAWIGCDSATGDFSGTPFGRNQYPIQLRAQDPFQGVSTLGFSITVPNSSPVQNNLIPTQLLTVNNDFSYTINSNTVSDVDGDTLTYKVQSSPFFLKFDNLTRVVSGTPTPQTANGITTTDYTLKLLVSDGHGGSCVVNFVVNVSGATYWKTVYQAFGYVVTGFISAYEFYVNRDIFLNRFRKEKYKKPEAETAFVGNYYSHDLKLGWEEVERVIVLSNGFALPPEKPFPDGLEYRDNKLQGTPTGDDVGEFTVRIVKHGGGVSEEFPLKIKKE